MKKILCLLLAGFLLSGCKNESKYEDYVGGNPSGSFNPIMETENGYYANFDVVRLCLSFFDKTTGKAVFLCSKPECTHDGNEYCNATKSGVIYSGNICLNGDYIYFSGQRYNETDNTDYYALYRTKTDGTELTEVCCYYKIKRENDDGAWRSSYNNGRCLLVHRGYAVIPYLDFEDKSKHTDEYGFKTAVINIEKGNVKILPETDYKLSDTENGQGYYYAYENYLYYTVSNDFMCENKELYRYDFITGETEKISGVGKITSYIISDGKIFYTTPPDRNTPSKLYTYNPENGEKKDISDELKINGDDFVNAELIYGGDYLILTDSHYSSHSTSYNPFTKNPDRVLIMTLDGKAVKEINLRDVIPTYKWIGLDNEIFSCELKYHKGKLYAVTMLSADDPRFNIPALEYCGYYERVFCCSLEDIISGTGEWSEPYDFYTLAENMEPIWEVYNA